MNRFMEQDNCHKRCDRAEHTTDPLRASLIVYAISFLQRHTILQNKTGKLPAEYPTASPLESPSGNLPDCHLPLQHHHRDVMSALYRQHMRSMHSPHDVQFCTHLDKQNGAQRVQAKESHTRQRPERVRKTPTSEGESSGRKNRRQHEVTAALSWMAGACAVSEPHAHVCTPAAAYSTVPCIRP